MEYICKLPVPIKFDTEIDALYFKEPSISQLRGDFKPVRGAFKKVMFSTTNLLPSKQNEKESEEKSKKENRTYEEIQDEGYQVLEFIEVVGGEIEANFISEFKKFIVKRVCFKSSSLELDTIFTKADLDMLFVKDSNGEMPYIENFDEIFAMYLGYFLPFFSSMRPDKIKKNIA